MMKNNLMLERPALNLSPIYSEDPSLKEQWGAVSYTHLACLSLLGFKTTTFITLGFPVIILFVPISDTLIAMVRRKLSGKGIMQADRSHLHHILMYKLKLGHRNTVLVLYLVTALFGGTAVLSYFNEQWGMIMLVVLTIVAEIFVEATEMINPKWHPDVYKRQVFTGLIRWSG